MTATSGTTKLQSGRTRKGEAVSYSLARCSHIPGGLGPGRRGTHPGGAGSGPHVEVALQAAGVRTWGCAW